MFIKKEKKIIKFYGAEVLQSDLNIVRPAKKFIPDWFKNLKPFIDEKCGHKTTKIVKKDEEGLTSNATAKQCLPLVDAFSLGYTIPMPFDINIEKTSNDTHVTWAFEGCTGLETFMGSHPETQIKGCPYNGGTNNKQFFKFSNPWHIVTPKGYSCLITAPINQFDLPIQILSGVVDTDTMHTINFPFRLNAEEGCHAVKVGTPLAQIIPFKREKWHSETETLMPEMVAREKARFDTFMHHYYKRVHHKKKVFL